MDRLQVILRWTAVVLITLAVAGLSGGLGVLSVVYFQVYFGDDSFLKKSAILAKINEETSIYYLDGTTRVGSFFESAHRRYVPIDEIPADVINAIVAAEDKNFYNHSGVDYAALITAVAEGLKSGRFRRGGSTLTQQTVKNILDRRERTLTRKFREMIAALQLERMYDKKQILEFYLNQFHVASNGNGIGIAARYYFNKEVADLNLVEAAFIAGSVKAPSKYNPFIKFTQEERERSIVEAIHRKNYVLRRMYEQGWISEEVFKTAWEQPVVFHRGRFRNSEVALVELVRRHLNRPEVLEKLNLESIADLGSAGLKIYTTVDGEAQAAAQLAMRRNLSRLETILKGFKPESEDEFQPLRDIEVTNFYFGRIVEIAGPPGQEQVRVNFGYPEGTIPHEALVRYAKLLDLPDGRGPQVHLKELVSALKVGQILYVEVKEYDRTANHAVLELHKRPTVNGGLIALDGGEVRTVVSGFDTSGFNRAIQARRPPGSVFKSIVYYAALQLGWSIFDKLDNERQLFPYQGQFYYPRPDHPSPYTEVSMIWSGVMSENLAAVHLAANLLEKVNLAQFREILGHLDLLPHAGEAPRDYHYRVARAIGVQLDNEGVREYQLRGAIADALPDLVFQGQGDLLRRLRKMWWGRGYLPEMKAIYAMKEDEERATLNEKIVRLELLKNNYIRMSALATQAKEDWASIAKFVSENSADKALADPVLGPLLARFRVLGGERPALGYHAAAPGEDAAPPESGLDVVTGRPLNVLDVQAVWGDANLFSSGSAASLTADDVRLEGYLPVRLMMRLQDTVAARFEAVRGIEDEYDLPRYFQHHDFRIGLGLNYLVALTQAMGVQSKLEPVLSFPLGTNDVTLAEVAKVYQTFIDGTTYRFFEEGSSNQLSLVRRIEDRFGNLLYEPQKQVFQLAPKEYSASMREILRRVVTHGTGRRARGELFLDPPAPSADVSAAAPSQRSAVPVRVPAFGKTGTTNDFTTASFAGFMPYPVEKGTPLDPSNSYAIASYVGYDFNATMRRGPFRVHGSMGALPVWTDYAKELLRIRKYEDALDRLNIETITKHEWPLKFAKNATPVKVDLTRGLVISETDVQDSTTYQRTDLATTGEDLVNEFSPEASVQTIVYIPQVTSEEGRRPLRFFRLFARPTPEAPPDPSSTPTSENIQDLATGDLSRIVPENERTAIPVPANSVPAPATGGTPQTPEELKAQAEAAPPPKPAPDEASAPPSPVTVDRQAGGENEDEASGQEDKPDPGYVEEELW